jgi:hypothetical protein
VQFPFDEIAICRETGEPFTKKLGPKGFLKFVGVTETGWDEIEVGWIDGKADKLKWDEYPASAVPTKDLLIRLSGAPKAMPYGRAERGNSWQCKFPGNFLIVLLATRNAVKHTTENKLAKLGIGKKNKRRYSYSTTITLPDELELEADPEHHTQGKPKCPHLRRGHIRRQHWGPARAYEKKVWIAPIFVNADHDFVATRTHYNVSPTP